MESFRARHELEQVPSRVRAPVSTPPPRGPSQRQRALDRLSVMLAYSVGWGLIGIAFVVLGVVAIVRRDAFARNGAGFHRRVASWAPWLYPAGRGTTEREWRVSMIPMGVVIMLVGVMWFFKYGL